MAIITIQFKTKHFTFFFLIHNTKCSNHLADYDLKNLFQMEITATCFKQYKCFCIFKQVFAAVENNPVFNVYEKSIFVLKITRKMLVWQVIAVKYFKVGGCCIFIFDMKSRQVIAVFMYCSGRCLLELIKNEEKI